MSVALGHQTAAKVLLQQSRFPFLKGLRDIQGIGIDLVTVSRFTRWLNLYDREALSYVFTPGEIDFCQTMNQPDLFHAICFATKEAVGKALGTGLVEIQWTDIEAIFTKCHSDHQLDIQLQGNAQQYAKHRGIDHWQAIWVAWDDHVLLQAIGFRLAIA